MKAQTMISTAIALSATLLAASVPAAKPPAGKPAAAKLAPFDARDPAAMVALINSMKAQASITKSEGGEVALSIATPVGGFGGQMIGCDPSGKACHAIALFTSYENKGATLEQINDFNRAQFACRGVLAQDGRPGVMYSTLVNFRMTQDETKQHLGVWQGCMKAFDDFARNPVSFLSKPH